MRSLKKIAFFGGTFDPIHIGHLQMALEVKEHYNLDEVVFCPVNISPFKTDNPPQAPSLERLEMTKLAIFDIPFFSTVDFEIKKEGVSYTVDTIKTFIETRSEADQYSLLLSEDAAMHLEDWKNPSELLQLVSLIICRRYSKKEMIPTFLKGRDNIDFFKNSVLEISSTQIRDRLKKKLYCDHLIPRKVVDYIHLRNLYSNR